MINRQIKHIISALLVTSFFSIANATPIVESTSAIKWWRDSAERNAIYREVFLMAENIIRQKVESEHLKPHEWGVIFDVDETILDNSDWNYEHDIKGKQIEWDDFAAKGISKKTPGSKELIDEIRKLGGYVNLVTNRKLFLQKITEKNLRGQGLYYDQVLYDTSDSKYWYVDKNSRFNAIIKGVEPSKFESQKIVAWFGDNIQDFPNIKQSQIIKQKTNSKAYSQFGVTYFALPNPMYGSWEDNPLK